MLLKYISLLLIIQVTLSGFNFHENNICKTFQDYYYVKNNPNCFYDPDQQLDMPTIIQKYTGVVENCQVLTEDGYILTLFRIPKANPKGVVLFHHSIATSSRIYLWEGNNSLAISMWHAGFDIWLANHRGTSYSTQHINKTISDYSYWNFSSHEIGLYDISAEIKLIKNKTNGSKIIYFGHSLGAGVGLIYASLKPEEAKNSLKTMILVGTPSSTKFATTILIYFAYFVNEIEKILDFLKIGSPLITYPLIQVISKYLLRLFPIILFIISVSIWATCGYTPSETNPEFFNFDVSIYTDNFSWKTFLHYLQIHLSQSDFQMYDYGKNENIRIYGQTKPLLYPVNHISVPIVLVSSYNDSLTTSQDSDILYERLSPEAKIFKQWKISGLNHLDFLVGKHRRELFTNKLISILHNL